jgi:glycosyltransferase involved in cell wall biosynthesis
VHSALDGRIFRKECRALERAGFQVTVIGPHAADAVADRVQIRSVRKHPARLARMTHTVLQVCREALRQDADLYHFHDPELIPVGLLLRAKGKKVIYDIHEDLPKDILSKPYLPRWSRWALAGMIKRVEQLACGCFSAMIAVTPAIAERFRTLKPPTRVVYNYPCVNELVLAHDPIPWSERAQSVAYVGGIMRQRAIREMVFAMGRLPLSLPATLELAGTEVPADANPDELRHDAGWVRVCHHGLLDQPATFRLLRRVRAGLVLFHPEPNHTEAMPQKIFEYMGAGLPVIASDFPLWRRILGEINCAIFVDPTSPDEIARAIEYVLTHSEEAEQMGLRGRAAVLRHYNWESEAQKLVQLYCGLLGTPCAA